MPNDFQYLIYTGPRKPSGEVCGVFNRGGVKGLDNDELFKLFDEITKEYRERLHALHANRKPSVEPTE